MMKLELMNMSMLTLKNITDYVQTLVAIKKFTNCKRKCDSCGSKVIKITETNINEKKIQTSTNEDKYLALANKVSSNIKERKIGEPVLFNPNSYENIVRIISSLKANLEIGRSRQWSIVGCDGPPYCLASRIIEPDPTNYDWISLISGLGHLNMNQLKTFFKIVDKIFLKALGKEVLNFD